MSLIEHLKSIKIFAYIWRRIRHCLIVRKQKKVSRLCCSLINDYYSGKIEHINFTPKRKMQSPYIIWQYWGQGFDEQNLPELVKICFDSIDRCKGTCEVIRLCDNNISDYLDLPLFVKQRKEHFSKTFFSDLLRLCLLTAYGGVWIDATVLLTKPLPDRFFKYDYFMFQRDDNETDKKYWENAFAAYWGWDKSFKVRCLNSVFFAQKGCSLVVGLTNMLLHVWKECEAIPYYFFFQILYQEVIQIKPDYRCPIESDCNIHLLQQIVYDNYDKISWDKVLSYGIHKLSYKAQNLDRLKEIIKTCQS